MAIRCGTFNKVPGLFSHRGRWWRALVLPIVLVCSGTVLAAPAPVKTHLSMSSDRLEVGDTADVTLTIDIDDGWHINSNKPGIEFLIPTTVTFELPEGVRLTEVRYPTPVVKEISLSGGKEISLLEGKVAITAGVFYDRLATGGRAATAVLRYQACNDTLCLRPQLERIPFPAKFALVEGVAVAGVDGESADIIARLVAGGWLVLVPGMLVLGLALNLTPCVYPLVSVTVAYFGGQAGSSRGKRLNLALAYMLGIALTFSVFGLSAALSGSFFGSALANPWVLGGVSLLMVLLALSSFGVYQFKIPDRLAATLGRSSTGIAGALLMGATMGIVAAPCVGPIVAGLLVFVGSRADPALGFGLFFLLAVGLGAPYVVLAMAAGSIKALPRSGDWLQWTEHLFGCVLLGMAIYFAGPLLPEPLKAYALPAFAAAAAVYLAFIDPAGSGFRGFVVLRRTVGVVVLVALAGTYAPTGPDRAALQWTDFSQTAFESARRSGKPFVVDFTAEWCLPCKEMEERTFTDAAVLAAGEDAGFLSVDMTTGSDRIDAILRDFDVLGAPTTIFFGADGKERERRVGFVGPTEFAELLESSY